jgi:membrane peptidoglycan carboxypeptidase
MEGVVDHGTAKAAQIPRYTVAGKTGTAAKLINGHYSKSEYNASFVAFVPSRNPALALIVVIDSPHGKGYYGGVVSAPIVKRIAEPSLRYLGVPPDVDPAPPVLVARSDEAPRATTSGTGFRDAGTGFRESGTGFRDSRGNLSPNEPVVSLVADAAPGTVPALLGLSARDAVRELVKRGLNARVDGDGVVVAQAPGPGAPVEAGAVCRLVLARSPVRRPTGDVQP